VRGEGVVPFRLVILGLLALSVSGRSTVAADIAGASGPELGDTSVSRLPPLESAPSAVEEQLPDADEESLETLGPDVPVKLWKGSVELGLNGSDGNSRTLDFRFGAKGKRKVPGRVLSFDLDYHRGSTDSRETTHRAFLDWRHDWLFEETPWTLFLHGIVEYDEFKPFDLRVSTNAGLGYQFIKDDLTALTGRLGGGFSHEIGSPDDSYVPELIAGLDYEHKLTKRQTLAATIDYTPDVTNFNDYRLNTKASWTILLDEEPSLNLKLFVLNRFDSTPHGARPNDLDYSAVLLWKF